MITRLVGDARQGLATLPAQSIGTIVTSPPYNIGATYDKWNDRLPQAEYEAMLDAVAQELLRVAKDDASFFLQVGSRPSDPMQACRILSVFTKYWQVQNTIIWVKSLSVDGVTHGHFKPVNSKRFLTGAHEFIFHLTKTKKVPLDRLAVGVPFMDKSNIKRFHNAGDKRCRGNVWYLPYDTVQTARKHPASFPFELPLWCIQLGGCKGPVLDPFAGAGTTLKAAHSLGLDSIGIDVSAAYLEEAV